MKDHAVSETILGTVAAVLIGGYLFAVIWFYAAASDIGFSKAAEVCAPPKTITRCVSDLWTLMVAQGVKP